MPLSIRYNTRPQRRFNRQRSAPSERVRRIAHALLNKQKRGVRTLPLTPDLARPVADYLRSLGGVPPRYPGKQPPRPRRNQRQPQQVSRVGTKKKAMAQIDKVEAKGNSKAVVEVVSTPTQSSVEWDVNGFYTLLECLTAYYAMETDLFLDLTPQAFAYYCAYMAMAHFNQCGSLGGGASFPSTTNRNKLVVPFALAKYLEYLSPYTKNTITVANRWTYTTNSIFLPTYTNTGVGAYSGLYPRPSGMLPNWMFLPMSNTLADPVQATIPPSILSFPLNLVGATSFGNFILNDQLLAKISSQLAKRGNCLPIGQVPSSAPDSSAYARLVNNTFGSNVGIGGVDGIDNNFDPEIVSLFAPIQKANGYYSGTTNQSYVPPKMTIDVLYPSDFVQIGSVWVWIAQHYEGKYTPGKIRDSFTVYGTKLESLYPTEQPVSGISLSATIQSVHDQLIAAQGRIELDNGEEHPDVDRYGNGLTLEATVAYAAQQVRQNKTEVIHLQAPAMFTTGGANIICPQFFYMDDSFTTTLFPQIAAQISAVGVCVVNGSLRIPFNNYEGFVVNSVNALGPIAWSVNSVGDITQDPEAPINNYTTAWTITGDLAAGLPKIQFDNTGPTPVMGTDMLSSWYAAQNETAGIPGFIYPCNPTAGAAACVLTQFKGWVQRSSYAQSMPYAPLNSSLKGDLTVMTSTHTVSPQSASTQSSQPVFETPSEEPSTMAQVVLTNLAPDTASYSIPTDKVSSAFSAIAGQGISDLRQSNSTELKRRPRKIILAFANRQAVAEIPDAPDNQGPFNVDIPWSTGKGGLQSAIAQQLSTGSQFSTALAKSQFEPKYDIVKLVKQYLGPSLKQSMASIPTVQMPAKQYVQAASTMVNDGGASSKSSGNFVTKAINVGESAVKVASKAAGLLEMFV